MWCDIRNLCGFYQGFIRGLAQVWFFALTGGGFDCVNHFFLLPLVRLAKNSPVGESLSFVSAKESNQRKTDPGSAR
ncbi:hypothetical protein, partial [Rheinheimera texasensis]|uniref:hypothetical protein n=1 Tax=Rheinheimera texasensis TaxID=306205 RepID=UPI0032B305B7